MKNKYPKYLVYLALFILVSAGGILYYFTRNYQPYIFNLVEMAHNGDTVYCTLENYTINHKTGSPDRGVLVHSYHSNDMQHIVNQKVKLDITPNTPTFLGYGSGFVWFNRNEKLVLVYLFKKDSVLVEDATTQLLNSINPGMPLANISYAPTRGVVYAQITNGDQFVINPKTFKYVSVKSELESYKYGLLPDTKIESGGERLSLDSIELVFEPIKKFNLKRQIQLIYTLPDGITYQTALQDTASKIKNEFINPNLILYQNHISILKHQNQIGDSAQILITAIDLKAQKAIWQTKAITLFNTKMARDVRAYQSLNETCFYLLSDESIPIKININTGNIIK